MATNNHIVTTIGCGPFTQINPALEKKKKETSEFWRLKVYAKLILRRTKSTMRVSYSIIVRLRNQVSALSFVNGKPRRPCWTPAKVSTFYSHFVRTTVDPFADDTATLDALKMAATRISGTFPLDRVSSDSGPHSFSAQTGSISPVEKSIGYMQLSNTIPSMA
uniref:Uncharacterized protein n=1 Tax=Angiostrongylus cantonensis TaxID=6313 RepID=A0A0K0DAZ7_ANGCA